MPERELVPVPGGCRGESRIVAKTLKWGRIPQRAVKLVSPGGCRIGYIGGLARKTRSQTGIGNGARPARPYFHMCGFFCWPGKARWRFPAVDSAPSADRLPLLFLVKGERPIEHGHDCGPRPLVPRLALRVYGPCFNQERFNFGPSAFLCDGKRSKAVVPKCCGLACVVYVDARFNLCLHLFKLSVAYR